LLLAATASFSQRYPILHVADSPRGIFTMMQDSRSRIWMGTIDDVVSFDGARFYSLREYGFPKEIPNGFGEDNEGGIWIVTQGTDVSGGKGRGGLYRYEAGRVEKMFSGDGLSVVSVAPGAVLASFGTELEGRAAYGDLYLFRKRHGVWVAERLLEKSANHMTVDRRGTTLFPCPGGWCELPRQQLADWQGSNTKLGLRKHEGSPLVERVLRDRLGCVWFRAESAASYQCPDMLTVARVSDTLAKYDSSAHLEEASDGSIFMLVNLALGRPGAFQTATVANGIPPNMDTAMVAKDGTIWIGSDTGLYRFMYPFRLEYWNQDNGLVSPYSILGIDGKTFTTSTGIATLDNNRRSWTTLAGTERLGRVSKLIAGPKRTIFAAFAHGVAQVRIDGTIIARSGFSEGITSLARTKDDEVWAGGGLSKKGISRVSRQGDRLILTAENLPAEATPDLEYDAARDTMWACYGKELLFRTGEEWHHITNSDGLLDFDCRYVALHPNGDIWLAYSFSPFALIRNALSGHPIIKNYSDDLEKQGAYTAFLNVDRRGWIWRNRGVDYVANSDAAEGGEWLRLDWQDGLPAPGGNPHSFFSDADGSVWFANSATIVHFSPAKDFATYFPSPDVFISGFSVGQGKDVPADTVETVPSGKDVVAHIGSLQFDRRNALRVRYRLLPEQAAWQSERELDIGLHKLRWGSHTLEVQAQLSTGPWSATESKSFTVLRPMWLSLPALMGFAVAGGAAAAGVYRHRMKRKERAKKRLPELAELRVAALSPEIQSLEGIVLDSRFELGRVLARGGFATVIEGRDHEQRDRPCAVKIFKQQLLDTEWMAKRFQQEVRALEKIRHPNVVGIYGHGETPYGAPYLVMEFVDGGTLRESLAAGSLGVRETAAYLRQIGAALGEIHARGICHRDVKPENLMIRSGAPPGWEVVLIDFSIALVKDPDDTLHGLTHAAGTIYYMAPEQAIGYADASSDIYSLAKLVMEMLTGRRLSSLLPDVSLELPERVRELLAGLPYKLTGFSIELMSAALEFDPRRRPTNANEFASRIAQDLESGARRS
jgi:tRNA A-37 threonylcarbamoyl transferase component Bud32/ligand-binding sensor domain-containing protein